MTKLNDKILFTKNFDEVKNIFEQDNRKIAFTKFEYSTCVEKRILVDTDKNNDFYYVFVFHNDNPLHYRTVEDKKDYKKVLDRI